jgi:hypothetical protein
MKIDHRGVPTLPVTLLRDSVAREVARQSLRHAALKIGISPNGLRNFVNGAAPRSSTRVRLERWLAAQHRVSRPPNIGQFVRLLGEVAGDLSPQQTLALGREVAQLVAAAYEQRRLSPPSWVKELAKRFRATRRAGVSDVA